MSFKPGILVSLLLTLAICVQAASATDNSQTSTPPSTPASPDTGNPAVTEVAATLTTVPQGFSSYASQSVGDTRHCVVGAVSDEDGMNQKPLVYVEDTVANRVLWAKPLTLHADTNQGRATHCLHKGSTLYVLLQSDTQATQTTSQTFLQIVELDLAKGTVTNTRDINVPGVDGAYSAWVDRGEDGMHLAAKGLAIAGEYYRMADPDRHLPFQVTLH